MSFLDDLLRTLRAPLDFVRGRTSAVRGAEGRVQGDLQRIRNLPIEAKGELNYNKDLIKSYGKRAGNLKNKAQGRFAKNGNPGAAASEQGATSKKMGFFSKKRR